MLTLADLLLVIGLPMGATIIVVLFAYWIAEGPSVLPADGGK